MQGLCLYVSGVIHNHCMLLLSVCYLTSNYVFFYVRLCSCVSVTVPQPLHGMFSVVVVFLLAFFFCFLLLLFFVNMKVYFYV